jgi:hypothetical protein
MKATKQGPKQAGGYSVIQFKLILRKFCCLRGFTMHRVLPQIGKDLLCRDLGFPSVRSSYRFVDVKPSPRTVAPLRISNSLFRSLSVHRFSLALAGRKGGS